MKLLGIIGIAIALTPLAAEDGYRLWLRYEVLPEGPTLEAYQRDLGLIEYDEEGASSKLLVAIDELNTGLDGLLGSNGRRGSHSILVGTPGSHSEIDRVISKGEIGVPEGEGYLVKAVRDGNGQRIVVTSLTDQGVLYGVFALGSRQAWRIH